MADALPTFGLSTLTGTLQGGVNNLINTGSSYLDRFFPPDKREALRGKLVKFATERPYLASFLLSQLALSGPALALFIIMTITVSVFALLAGILVGLIGALLFIAFCLGFALIFLLPTLFFTTFAGAFIWLWGLGAYLIMKWFNQKEVPGVHTGFKKGVTDQLGLDGIPLLETGEDASVPSPERPRQKKEVLHEKKNVSVNGHASHEGEEKTPSSNRTSTSASKRVNPGTGKGTGMNGAVGDVTKRAGGIAETLGL
jgi:hypothetical protein